MFRVAMTTIHYRSPIFTILALFSQLIEKLLRNSENDHPKISTT